jgi:hypothetical protein
LYPNDPNYLTRIQKANIAVAPGDIVFVKVEYKKDDKAGLIEFFNYTQNTTCSANVDIPTGSGASVDRFRGDTIEWVVERPYNGSGYYPLANYTAIDFTSAAGETYGGSIVVSEQGDLINMEKIRWPASFHLILCIYAHRATSQFEWSAILFSFDAEVTEHAAEWFRGRDSVARWRDWILIISGRFKRFVRAIFEGQLQKTDRTKLSRSSSSQLHPALRTD